MQISVSGCRVYLLRANTSSLATNIGHNLSVRKLDTRASLTWQLRHLQKNFYSRIKARDVNLRIVQGEREIACVYPLDLLERCVRINSKRQKSLSPVYVSRKRETQTWQLIGSSNYWRFWFAVASAFANCANASAFASYVDWVLRMVMRCGNMKENYWRFMWF